MFNAMYHMLLHIVARATSGANSLKSVAIKLAILIKLIFWAYFYPGIYDDDPEIITLSAADFGELQPSQIFMQSAVRLFSSLNWSWKLDGISPISCWYDITVLWNFSLLFSVCRYVRSKYRRCVVHQFLLASLLPLSHSSAYGMLL